jgi:hypothetical protein
MTERLAREKDLPLHVVTELISTPGFETVEQRLFKEGQRRYGAENAWIKILSGLGLLSTQLEQRK